VLVVHYGEESSQRFEWRANFDYYVRDALNKTKLTFFLKFCWRLRCTGSTNFAGDWCRT
jgi:hypothetical protein